MIPTEKTPAEIEAQNALIRNDGNLPVEHDMAGRKSIVWKGTTIREQFPWTRTLGESHEPTVSNR